jgi:hypothetical protein
VQTRIRGIKRIRQRIGGLRFTGGFASYVGANGFVFNPKIQIVIHSSGPSPNIERMIPMSPENSPPRPRQVRVRRAGAADQKLLSHCAGIFTSALSKLTTRPREFPSPGEAMVRRTVVPIGPRIKATACANFPL